MSKVLERALDKARDRIAQLEKRDAFLSAEVEKAGPLALRLKELETAVEGWTVLGERLRTIVDEELGMQELCEPDELLSRLEQYLFERRSEQWEMIKAVEFARDALNGWATAAENADVGPDAAAAATYRGVANRLDKALP